jgi:hypothetical protein
MKHAGKDSLNKIETLLGELRELFKKHEGVVEKKTGTFYKKSSAFLHFHEDPAGMFADLKIDGQFERFEITTRKQQIEFLQNLEDLLT